jgi:hypothetical protein
MNRPAVVFVAVLASASFASAGWKEVPVDVAVPARIRVEPGERTLVTMFRGNPHERLNIGLEVSRWVRREVARRTPLAVLDVPPPAIPEQRAEALAVNDAFWRRLGEDFEVGLLIAGIAEFRVEDRSGFVYEDVESPITGQTVRRSRYAERRGYRLRMQVFFLKGDNGALLYTDTWTEDRTVEGIEEDLTQLHALLESMSGTLRAALTPTRIQEPRYIWVKD